MKITHKITKTGQLPTHEELLSNFASKGVEVMNKVLKIDQEAAIKDYSSKRKTNKMPSKIISSFNYNIESANKVRIVGIVFAGGPKAPYLEYVDKGHSFRGGKGRFEGYHFMDVGFKAGEAAIDSEITKTFVLGK